MTLLPFWLWWESDLSYLISWKEATNSILYSSVNIRTRSKTFCIKQRIVHKTTINPFLDLTSAKLRGFQCIISYNKFLLNLKSKQIKYLNKLSSNHLFGWKNIWYYCRKFNTISPLMLYLTLFASFKRVMKINWSLALMRNLK
jgi:hypothetical protein